MIVPFIDGLNHIKRVPILNLEQSHYQFNPQQSQFYGSMQLCPYYLGILLGLLTDLIINKFKNFKISLIIICCLLILLHFFI